MLCITIRQVENIPNSANLDHITSLIEECISFRAHIPSHESFERFKFKIPDSLLSIISISQWSIGCRQTSRGGGVEGLKGGGRDQHKWVSYGDNPRQQLTGKWTIQTNHNTWGWTSHNTHARSHVTHTHRLTERGRGILQSRPWIIYRSNSASYVFHASIPMSAWYSMRKIRLDCSIKKKCCQTLKNVIKIIAGTCFD